VARGSVLVAFEGLPCVESDIFGVLLVDVELLDDGIAFHVLLIKRYDIYRLSALDKS
jgi:hypothetical protein